MYKITFFQLLKPVLVKVPSLWPEVTANMRQG